jgi:peptidoglycan/LPS O-acetylase OafA/YrhL
VKVDRRLIVSGAVAVAFATIWPVTTLAATGIPVGDPPAVEQGGIDPRIWLVGAGAVALAVAVIAVRVPAARRPIGAILVMAAAGFGAFVIVMVGALSSWTDRGDNIPPPFQAGAIATLVVGLVIAAFVLLGGRRKPGTADHD